MQLSPPGSSLHFIGLDLTVTKHDQFFFYVIKAPFLTHLYRFKIQYSRFIDNYPTFMFGQQQEYKTKHYVTVLMHMSNMLVLFILTNMTYTLITFKLHATKKSRPALLC